MPCTKKGQLLPMKGGGIAICDAGKYRYAFAKDLPKAPAKGYTKRPAWYPTLDSIFGQPEATCKASTVKFTSAVLPIDHLAPSTPYGMMVGYHVTPIDHGYIGVDTLNLSETDRTRAAFLPITSPAAGTVIQVQSLEGPTPNYRMVINHGCGVYTAYMVMDQVATGIAVGTKVAAGQQIGAQRDHPMDFNVFSSGTWLSGFANPLSYAYGESWKPYTADPSGFWPTNIANAYAAQMQRTSSPRWGKIDYDVVGSASGNWFLDGTAGYSGIPISDLGPGRFFQFGSVPGKNYYAYGHLAIAPHWVDPTVWIASMGSFLDPNGDASQHEYGQFYLDTAGKPTPDTLTAANGTVVYDLYQPSPADAHGQPIPQTSPTAPLPIGYTVVKGSLMGSLALRVNADGSLTMQTTRQGETFTAFTAAARTFRR